MTNAPDTSEVACEIKERCPYCGSWMIQRRKMVCIGCGYCESCCDGGKQAIRSRGEAARALSDTESGYSH